MSASVVSVRLRGHGRISTTREKRRMTKLPSARSGPGPTWRTQVIDDDAALEAAIGSMERPLVVVEPA